VTVCVYYLSHGLAQTVMSRLNTSLIDFNEPLGFPKLMQLGSVRLARTSGQNVILEYMYIQLENYILDLLQTKPKFKGTVYKYYVGVVK
jgi:hypothetical protein